MTETQQKLARLAGVLDAAGLDAVVLQTRANFAWITGGRDNHVGRANPNGSMAIVAWKDGRLACLTSTIEAPRARAEATAGLGFGTLSPYSGRGQGEGRASSDSPGQQSSNLPSNSTTGPHPSPLPEYRAREQEGPHPTRHAGVLPAYREREPEEGIEVVAFPWWDADAAKRVARDLLGDARVAADFDSLGMGWPALPASVTALRATLMPQEIERYRTGAAIARDAIEETAAGLTVGVSEFEIAGRLDLACRRRGGHALTTLIAVDDRLHSFRHPIPTERKLERVAMLVVGCEFGGLITSCTRIAHVGPIPSDLQRRLQAVADVDATAIAGTRVGRKLSDVFGDLQTAYARVGFADEWQNHHQGGLTGYAPREQLASPSAHRAIGPNQAFAWNPSVPGCKSEDTVLLTEQGVEVLTKHGSRFPTITGKANDGTTVGRPGILEL